MLSFLAKAGKWIASWLVGGSLEKILDVIDKKMDDEVKKEEIKAEVTKKWIDAQSALLVGRTWWFQLFFVVPLGVYWASLLWVCAFPQWGWTVHSIPDPYNDWAALIVSALYMVDGGKALIGRIKK